LVIDYIKIVYVFENKVVGNIENICYFWFFDKGFWLTGQQV